jgi:hypothetical protein
VPRIGPFFVAAVDRAGERYMPKIGDAIYSTTRSRSRPAAN